jgi:hypothetical protein
MDRFKEFLFLWIVITLLLPAVGVTGILVVKAIQTVFGFLYTAYGDWAYGAIGLPLVSAYLAWMATEDI